MGAFLFDTSPPPSLLFCGRLVNAHTNHMVNRNLIRGLDLNKDEWEEELAQAMGGTATEESIGAAASWPSTRSSTAKSCASTGEFVLVDVGYKSEGTIPLNEWEEDEEPPEPGQTRQGADRGRRRRLRPRRRIARHDRR